MNTRLRTGCCSLGVAVCFIALQSFGQTFPGTRSPEKLIVEIMDKQVLEFFNTNDSPRKIIIGQNGYSSEGYLIGPHDKLSVTTDCFFVKFINPNETPINIIKPLDGSETKVVMPWHAVSLCDTNGKRLVPVGGCDNYILWDKTKWPSDYVVTLPPGGCHTQTMSSLMSFMPTAGVFTVSFKCTFMPGTNDTVLRNPYPANLWRGEAAAATVTKAMNLPLRIFLLRDPNDFVWNRVIKRKQEK